MSAAAKTGVTHLQHPLCAWHSGLGRVDRDRAAERPRERLERCLDHVVRVAGRLDLGYPLKSGPRTERYTPRLNFSLTATY